jgi:hypothetical protein
VGVYARTVGIEQALVDLRLNRFLRASSQPLAQWNTAGVATESGVRATVGGTTRLIGGAITSSDKAVTGKANSFTTASSLTQTDLDNKSALDTGLGPIFKVPELPKRSAPAPFSAEPLAHTTFTSSKGLFSSTLAHPKADKSRLR